MRILNTELFERHRDPERMVLPELVSLGWFVTSESRLGGARTDGYDGYEIGYLEHGSIEWWTEAGLEEAGPGSVLIDRPGMLQGGRDAIVHPCRRYWLRFNFPPVGRLPGLSDASIAALREICMAPDLRHFPASGRLKDLFIQLLEQQRAPKDFAEDLSRALFHQILFTVVHDYRFSQRATLSAPVRRALRFFAANRDHDFSIEDVAGHAGLSTGYFHELFLREIGYTPAQYHLRTRINEAKRKLIHTDIAVTRIAMEHGFSSSQYFATAFRKIVGLTPSQYRTLRKGPHLDEI